MRIFGAHGSTLPGIRVDLAPKAIYLASRGAIMSHGPPGAIRCDGRLQVTALPGLPVLGAGDDLGALVAEGLARADLALADGDVVVLASKIVSRAEGRFVDLATVAPSTRALEAAARTGKDARLCELILGEAQQVSRVARGALVVRHRLGFVTGDAGIDASNALPRGAAAGSGPWALLLPVDPDASAERLRASLSARSGAAIGVVVSDSFGRPFRLGTVGAAIGVAGLPALWDRRGERDLFGRVLEHTVTALADQVAAAADLVAGQAAEGRGAVHVRGLSFAPVRASAAELCRPLDQDLYA
jgi:coenzyme F420-0:L-glutamate ligase/coenzyme F420-1:gamma-L-glutamate ligase